jgi:hypothetical protein
MKNLLCILFIIALYTNGYSQTYEAGIFLGGANYVGDLAPSLVITETKPAAGLFFKKNQTQHISFKGEINLGFISGKDSNFEHLAERNLDFRSHILEANVQAEFNFFPYAIGINPRNHTPFLFIGFGIFGHSPWTYYEDERVKLRPLRTEGASAETRYTELNFAIPVGFGYKYSFSDRFNLSFQTGARKIFIDYLDDVSTNYSTHYLSDRSLTKIGKPGKQRGNNDLNDWYGFAGITIAYRIQNPVCYFFY